MKLHWVELENWRRHARRKIEFDKDATVIYGPNETGKSTMLEALSRGLFDRSSSQAEAIRAVKPLTAPGNVTSTVRIEFTLSKTRYRVEKNFNLKRGTLLYKILDGTSVLQAQDDSADEQLIQLLEADLPSPRGSKPSQWGAFRWLWAPQDGRELPTEKEGDPTASLHLERVGTGGMLATPKFQAVHDLAQAAYAKYFTKTGRATGDSPILSIQGEIENLQRTIAGLTDKIREVEDEKRQLNQLEQQLPLLERKRAESKEELAKAKTEAADFSSIGPQLDASEAAVKAAERDVEDAEKAVEELNKAAEGVENLQVKEKKAKDDMSRLEAVCEQLEKALQEIRDKVEERAMVIRQCEELTRDARILWTKADTEKKIEELKAKIKRIETITREIENLRSNQVALAPSTDEVEEIGRTQTRIEVLKASLAARGLAVTISPGEKGSLGVEVDGEKLEAGALNASGTTSVRVVAPHLGEVTVKANLEDARDAKADLGRMEESVQAAIRKYSVSSIDHLKELNRAQNDILEKIKQLEAERRGVDRRSVEEIAPELTKCQERYDQCQKIGRTPTAERLNPVDADLGRLVNEREKEEGHARTALDEARTERDRLDGELQAKKEELAGIRVGQKHLADELDNAKKRERELIRRYGSQESQEKKLEIARASLAGKTGECERIKKRHKELEKGPVNRIQRLEKQIENQEQVIRQHQTSMDQLKGAISVQSLQGAYSELGVSGSRVEILEERLAREKVRADACRLLKESLEQQYRSALLAVVGPIQEEVKRSLSYVTGFVHDDVELNEYLFPVRMGEQGFEDISLEFSDASSGLKETLALCVRLAVAKHLSERESQCLVLDDPFVHVSSDRSNRMVELINEAMKESGLQVVIFTHRPMEFSGFTGKMVDIQSRN